MAKRPLRLCTHPGCRSLVVSGRCAKHQVKRTDKEYDRQRGTPAERGYDNSWVKFRKWYLSLHPLCDRCMKQGRIEPATLIHHIKALKDGGSKYDEGNLVATCFKCHEIIEGRMKG